MGNNKNSQTAKQVLDATQEMSDWLGGNWYTLAEAVAKFAIFCPVEKYKGNELIRHEKNGCLFCRKKASQVDIKKGAKGVVQEENIIWDDNSAINYRFKKIIGQSDCRNYVVCHIYSGLAHNPIIFSSVANLVLLPNVLAGLSDHCDMIKEMLAHRVYQLFRWYPENEGFFIPEYNEDYINLPWRDQAAAESWESNKPHDLLKRLQRWSQKKQSIVYQAIKIAISHNSISCKEFADRLEGMAASPKITIASLMTDRGNAYGRVFEYADNQKKTLAVRQDLRKRIEELWK